MQLALNIPLPESNPTSPSSQNYPYQLSPPHSNIHQNLSLTERTLTLIIQSLLPILSGEKTLLSLYDALDKFSQESNSSLNDQSLELFNCLSERHDQLDRLKVLESTDQLKQEKVLPPPSDQSALENSDDYQSTQVIKVELESLQIKLKQEEEKRAKSISLLRAVRQKLVQTEKDKTGLENDLTQVKSNTSAKIEQLKSEKKSLENELSKVKIFNDQQLSKLRHSSEREMLAIKSQYERDAASQKSQFELDTITTKAAHERELSTRTQKVSQLENRLRELSADRDKLFDRLQNKQAELEVIQAQHDEIKGNMGELTHQLNESQNRIHSLVEELDHLHKLRLSHDQNEGESPKLVQELEQQHLIQTKAFQLRINQLEQERLDIEQELTDRLQERLQQIEILRSESRLKSQEYAESLKSMAKRNEEILKSDTEMQFLKVQLASAEQDRDSQIMMVESLKQQLEELQNQLNNQTSQLEDLRSELKQSIQKESELRSENQRIRDNEIKKVEEVKELFLRGAGTKMMDQNQRKEGVGYFANFSRQSLLSPSKSSTASPIKNKSFINSQTSMEFNDDNQMRDRQQVIHSPNDDKDQDQNSNSNSLDSRTHLPLTRHSFSSSPPEKLIPHSAECQGGSYNNQIPFDPSLENEAALNFEYLRNTLLQFLEHQEMRPHLVRVLGVILHFTPQEIRRLAAKV